MQRARPHVILFVCVGEALAGYRPRLDSATRRAVAGWVVPFSFEAALVRPTVRQRCAAGMVVAGCRPRELAPGKIAPQ